MPVQPFGLRDDLETAVDLARCFRVAQKQYSAVAQREVKHRDHLRLRFRQQIDQQIAARHQVDAGERRVGQHILHREDHGRAQLGRDAIFVPLLVEKPCQTFRRHIGLDGGRVQPVPRAGHRVRIDIGGKHLKFDRVARRRDLLVEQHGEGICLLAGAATGDPDAYRMLLRLETYQIGNDLIRQHFEHGGVAKEVGDVDQQVLGEDVELGRVVPQHVKVAACAGGRDRRHRHAPFDPAP